MPNHCTNELRLTGPKEVLDQFRLDASQPAKGWSPSDESTEPTLLNFQGAAPFPEEGRDDSQGWYNWSVENWGTKWNAYDVDTNVTDQGISYDFTTAWSPPLAWLDAASAKYPEIKFMLAYFEGGCDFCGVRIIRDGKVILNHEAPAYDSDTMVDDCDWFDQQESTFWDDAYGFAKKHDMVFDSPPPQQGPGGLPYSPF